ncbi:MAG: peptidyl-prolyl cis-trans isomerase [Chthoniobacter sp.]|jgi:hypothetical protein|nr:peptidyl-prolyl cis-trans isomerase [Chthoniobacter sp.]
MVNLIRKHQQTLMVFVTIFIIITFVWFWNGSQTGRLDRSGSDNIGTIYGRHISETEVQREARKFYVALELGLIDLVQDLAGYDRTRAVDNFVWNLMVMRREADELQIVPSDEEIKAALSSLRPLQTEGQFDPNKLNELVQRSLAPRGFTETVIDDLIRDDLRLKKLKALIGSSIAVAPAEIRSSYEQEHQLLQAAVIRFNAADFEAGVQISDDDAKKTFDSRKDQYKSEEKRKVKFASFTLNEEEKKLTGAERNAALKKLAERATDFTQGMLENGAKFDEVAGKLGAKVETTGEFSASEPDPRLAGVPSLTAAAFQLGEDDPNSDVVQGENGFYVLHLEDVLPRRQLAFEEAKPKIIQQLKEQRGKEVLGLKAGEVRTKIQADLQAGKSFTEAASAAGQKVETIPPFSLSDPPKNEVADQELILEKAVELGEKQLSDVVASDAGSLMVYLEKREPVSDADFAKDSATLEPLFTRQKIETAFREWLRTRRDAAKLQLAQR